MLQKEIGVKMLLFLSLFLLLFSLYLSESFLAEGVTSPSRVIFIVLQVVLSLGVIDDSPPLALRAHAPLPLETVFLIQYRIWGGQHGISRI